MNLSFMIVLKVSLDTKNGETVKPLCIILADDDDDVILKYNKIWNKIKKFFSVEFDSQSAYDEKYIETTVKAFEDKVIIKFTDNEIPKESTHYSCIAAICFEN